MIFQIHVIGSVWKTPFTNPSHYLIVMKFPCKVNQISCMLSIGFYFLFNSYPTMDKKVNYKLAGNDLMLTT